jgi:adenosine deaminase
MEHVDLAIQLREDYDFKDLVVGIDLGGNPLKRDFTDFRKCFEKARANNLKVTLHCGEVPCDEKLGGTSSREYQDAECILAFKPDRLGHALLLPPSLQEQLLQLQIPVETCPTSNVMTLELNDTTHSSSTESVVEGLRRHPQLSAWLFGEDTSNEVSCVVENKFPSHPISICTDDSGVFNTDATQELALLVAAFQTRGVGIQELKDLIFQSVDFAFCDDQTKKEVKGRLVQGTCQ